MGLQYAAVLRPARMRVTESAVWEAAMRNGLATAGLCAVAVIAVATPGPVAGSDVRHEAQAAASEVTSLERKIASLAAHRAVLVDKVDLNRRRIERSRAGTERARTRFDSARSRVQELAVELYKSGGTSHLGVVMSEGNLSDVVHAAQMASIVATRDSSAILEFGRARLVYRNQRALLQARISQLNKAVRQVDALIEDKQLVLARRREVLEQLRDKIEQLQQSPPELPQDDLLPGGFARTGVIFEGTASWYGDGFEGQRTASGEVYDPDRYTAASKSLPLGTWLLVQHAGKEVIVKVNDRGPYVRGRVLDLSRAAAREIGIGGLGWIKAEVLVPR